jgi:hypothetical protein
MQNFTMGRKCSAVKEAKEEGKNEKCDEECKNDILKKDEIINARASEGGQRQRKRGEKKIEQCRRAVIVKEGGYGAHADYFGRQEKYLHRTVHIWWRGEWLFLFSRYGAGKSSVLTEYGVLPVLMIASIKYVSTAQHVFCVTTLVSHSSANQMK